MPRGTILKENDMEKTIRRARGVTDTQVYFEFLGFGRGIGKCAVNG